MRGVLLALMLTVCACGGSSEPEQAELETVEVDCAAADTTRLSPFVVDAFQRDLAIDTPKRITDHLDGDPGLICLTLRSGRHGELPVIGYAAAHRPDAYAIFPLLIERGAVAAEALPIAVELGKTRTITWLLENDVDPNWGDALLLAASFRKTRIVEQLLAAGADPNRMREQTALHIAAAHGLPAMISALLAAGADPDTRDGQNDPPLAEAVRQEKVSTILQLLEAGADPFWLQREEEEQLRRIATRWGLRAVLDRLG